MENISANITYKEATKSETAIRKGIDNTPNEEQLKAMKLVAEKVFEPVRKWYGKPITISSFFRSEKLNKAIGGSSTSSHCMGEAIDMDTDNDNLKLFNYIIENLDFDQVIYEFGDDNNPDWVHVGFKSKGNRKQVLRAIKVGTKTQYIPYVKK